jgi:hypothetical protein
MHNQNFQHLRGRCGVDWNAEGTGQKGLSVAFVISAVLQGSFDAEGIRATKPETLDCSGAQSGYKQMGNHQRQQQLWLF